MTGLGIAGLIKHTGEGGGSKDWLKNWHKGGKGEITIWLHTRAPIVPSLTHSFMLEDTYEDKESGRAKPVLRYLRFVSPDPEIVSRSLHFRNKDEYETIQTPPDRDPFLLLKEWLRYADHLALDQPIFRWNNEKDRKVIVWERGELSGLVKRGRSNAYHSLDTKFEYVYVVVDNAAIADGPVLMREGKLLSQRIVEVIKQQQKMHGEEVGDPLQHPYAFLCMAQEAASAMDTYKAAKNEAAEFTDEVWEALSGDEFPDPLPYGQPTDGDQDKIREAFEKAAQVELPIDAIFSEDPQVRRDLCKPSGMARQPARASRASQARAAANPPAPSRAETTQPKPATAPKPNGATGAAARSTTAAPQTTGTPQTRRRRVEPAPAPEPEPEPEVETIPCEVCQTVMRVTDTKCSKCGAEYEPIEDEKQQAPPPKAAAASVARPKPTTTAPKPTTTAAAVPQSAGGGRAPDPNCWSCGVPVNGATHCPSCGVDQGDDIPF